MYRYLFSSMGYRRTDLRLRFCLLLCLCFGVVGLWDGGGVSLWVCGLVFYALCGVYVVVLFLVCVCFAWLCLFECRVFVFVFV